MNEEKTMVPTPEQFFEICAQMLVAVEVLHRIAEQQSQEIRHLIAAIRAERGW